MEENNRDIKSYLTKLGWAILAGLLNCALGWLTNLLQIPLYLDTLGTVLAAIHLGLVPALLTAIVSHLLLGLTGLILYPFVCCSIMTALIAVLFRRKGWLRSLKGYLWLGFLLALANGIFGSLLSYALFEGVTMVHAIDRLVMGILMSGWSILVSIFWAGMVTNMMDKLLTGAFAFLLREPMRRLEG